MKYCRYCGAAMPDHAGFCPNCGRQEETAANSEPRNQGFNGNPYQPPVNGYVPFENAAPCSGMAVASMVLGIISMFINPLTILGILALILGLVALPQTAGGVRRGRGMAIAGIILGCIAVIYFIWAMANYNVLMSLLFQ